MKKRKFREDFHKFLQEVSTLASCQASLPAPPEMEEAITLFWVKYKSLG